MKNLFSLTAGLLLVGAVSAQDISLQSTDELADRVAKDVQVVAEADTSWKSGGILGLNAAQTLLNNWAPGGQSSITGTAYVNYFKNYAKGPWTWDNTFDFSYGILNNGIKEGNNVKIDDKIDIASKAGRQFKGDWYYSGLVNFKSQFAPGYEVVDAAETDNKISDFLAPAYLLASLGMDYKPNDNFTVFISPLTSKNTIVSDANKDLRGAYGFELNELGVSSDAIRSEFGGYAKIAYKKALAENIEFQTKIDLFSNYLDDPQNVDVNWENLLAVKFAKYFNVNFIVQMVYDDDIKILKEVNDANGNQVLIADPDNEGAFIGQTRGISTLQLRQVFGLGFSYKF